MRKYIISLAILGVGILIGVGIMRLLNKPEWSQTTLKPLQAQEITLGRKDGGLKNVPELRSLNGIFRNVAANAKPAVVFIEVLSQSNGIPKDGNHNQNWLAPNNGLESSSGSGVIVSQEGYIITNHHVVENATQIRVILENRQEFNATLVGTDPSTDLAVLKIPSSKSLTVVPVADAQNLAVGDWVVAIGSPFRLTATVTTGIVSALNRQIDIIDSQFSIENFIQTDAAINRGNSGGALLDLGGNLVGINAAIATESGSYEGYGFAIPVNLALRVAQDLIAYGKVRRGYMGLSLGMMTDSRSRQVGLPQIVGVMVDRVMPESAAERAGLQKGDVILSLNQVEMNAPNQVQNEVLMKRPGESIQLTVWRNGRTLNLGLTLLENLSIGQSVIQKQNKAIKNGSLLTEWGLDVLGLSASLKQDFKVTQGVYVQGIVQNSLAEIAQIPEDCVITKVENKTVSSKENLKALLQSYAATQDQIIIAVQKREGVTQNYIIDIN